MIAQRRRLHPNRVHRGDHRMGLATPRIARVGHVVAKRVALEEIAVVEQDRVRALRPDRADVGCGSGQARSLDRTVGIVVVGRDMGVQIGGLENAQMHLARSGRRRERGQGLLFRLGAPGHRTPFTN